MDIKSTVERLVEETREGKLPWESEQGGGGQWRLRLFMRDGLMVTVNVRGEIELVCRGHAMTVDGHADRKMVQESGLVDLLEQNFGFENELQKRVEHLNRCLDAVQHDPSVAGQGAGVGDDLFKVATNLLAAFEKGNLKPDDHGYVRVQDMIDHADLAERITPRDLAILLGKWEIPKGPACLGYHAEKLHSLLADMMRD